MLVIFVVGRRRRCDNEGENRVYWLWSDDCLGTRLKVQDA